MSHNWVHDIEAMHSKYGVVDWVNEKASVENFESLNQFLEFRIKFLEEELAETKKAVAEKDAEEVVDGLIDLCVVAIGTLDAFGVKSFDAWDEVLRANMEKRIGVKASRPNPLGLPDLVKPDGWTAPSHKGNHGIMERMWNVRSDNV